MSLLIGECQCKCFYFTFKCYIFLINFVADATLNDMYCIRDEKDSKHVYFQGTYEIINDVRTINCFEI